MGYRCRELDSDDEEIAGLRLREEVTKSPKVCTTGAYENEGHAGPVESGDSPLGEATRVVPSRWRRTPQVGGGCTSVGTQEEIPHDQGCC